MESKTDKAVPESHPRVEQVSPTLANTKTLLAQTFINRLSIPEGSKVLDLGCGNGEITSVLAEKVGSKGRVVGVDPDKVQLEIAKQSNKNDHVSFLEGDAENFPEDNYDLIFCNYVTHFIKDLRTAFTNISRNLRSGGQLAFVAILQSPPITSELSLSMGPEIKEEIDKMFFMRPTSVFDDLAKECGFTVTLREEDCDVFTFPNLGVVFKVWVSSTRGKFNPEKANQDELKRLKERYGETQPFEWKLLVGRYVLTKS